MGNILAALLDRPVEIPKVILNSLGLAKGTVRNFSAKEKRLKKSRRKMQKEGRKANR